MPQKPDRAALIGSWMHSHEESEGGRLVYRPSDYAFPPARGRDGFELRSDGAIERFGPGPDDRQQTQHGKWTLSGEQLRLDVAGGRSERYVVDEADDARLVLQRLE